ncbi:MAG: Crp/Fnr family transcriptional regulator [Balneola sp.]
MKTRVLDKLIKYGDELNLKKKSSILNFGEISNHMYFLVQGVVRHYIIDQNGNEKTIRISVENDFFYSSVVSFFRNEPSYISCEALTKVYLIKWNKKSLDRLMETDKKFETFRYQKLTEFILEKHQKEITLISDSAEKRFLKFCNTHGELFNRIPHYVIASYLNMTPEMLSRLRRKTFLDLVQ